MPGNNIRVGTQVTGVGKSSSDLDKLRDKFDKLQKQGGKGFAIGAGAAITAKGFSLLDTAASAVVGALGDATHAAMADEESQNRLRASLVANVAGFNGNTDAIEDNILAAQRLGFSDETLRDSLTVLVGATHDVGKAQSIMGTAMDLARFKGVDLRTASEALIKVEGGHYRALAQLGIKLRDGATSEEALTAVRKIATGQAEAYANTNSGKVVVSQIKVDEAMEHLGAKTMPLVAEGLSKLADVTVTVVDGLTAIAESPVGDVLGFIGEQAGHAATGMKGIGDFTRDFIDLATPWDGMASQVRGFGSSYLDAREDVGDATDDIADSNEDMAKSAHRAVVDIKGDLTDMVSAYEGARDELTSTAEGAADAIWDPLIAKGELASIEHERQEQKNIIASKDSTKEQVADAQARMVELNKAKFEQVAILASYGDKTALQTLETATATLKATKNLTREQVAQLKLLEIALNRARLAAAELNNALSRGHNQGGTGDRGRASGGPVAPNQSYTVGEEGPETLVMGATGGVVIPNGGGSGGGSAPAPSMPTVIFQSLWPPSPADQQRIRDMLGPILRGG